MIRYSHAVLVQVTSDSEGVERVVEGPFSSGLVEHRSQMKQCIKTCSFCQRNKPSNMRKAGLLQSH